MVPGRFTILPSMDLKIVSFHASHPPQTTSHIFVAHIAPSRWIRTFGHTHSSANPIDFINVFSFSLGQKLLVRFDGHGRVKSENTEATVSGILMELEFVEKFR